MMETKLAEKYKILDDTLIYMCDKMTEPHSFKETILMYAGYPKLTERESQTIIEKLLDDKYINEFIPLNEKPRYYITFSGEIFRLNGGYKEQHHKEVIQLYRQFALKWLIAIGSFAAIGLLAFEILNYYHHILYE